MRLRGTAGLQTIVRTKSRKFESNLANRLHIGSKLPKNSKSSNNFSRYERGELLEQRESVLRSSVSNSTIPSVEEGTLASGSSLSTLTLVPPTY